MMTQKRLPGAVLRTNNVYLCVKLKGIDYDLNSDGAAVIIHIAG